MSSFPHMLDPSLLGLHPSHLLEGLPLFEDVSLRLACRELTALVLLFFLHTSQHFCFKGPGHLADLTVTLQKV